MDDEYQLSALRVQRNVLRTELSDAEAGEHERLQRIERKIEELRDEDSKAVSVQ